MNDEVLARDERGRHFTVIHASPMVCPCSECTYDRWLEHVRRFVIGLGYLAIGLVATVAVWGAIVLVITIAGSGEGR